MYIIEEVKEAEYVQIFKIMKFNMRVMQAEIGLNWCQEKIEKNYRSKLGFSICKGGSLAAFMFIHIGHAEVFVHTLQVDKRYQNRFLGYTALKHIIKLARENSLSMLKCCVFDNNPAREIYKRIGFKEVKSDNRIITLELNINSIRIPKLMYHEL